MKNKSGSSTTRHEHYNTGETEENDFKTNFRKMFDALKREMKKKSLQEVEEKTNKILKESNTILKENEEKGERKHLRLKIKKVNYCAASNACIL